LERRRLVREKEAKANERAAQRALPHKFHRPEGSEAPKSEKNEAVKGSKGTGEKGDSRKRSGLFALAK
jgi:hypothetical protein